MSRAAKLTSELSGLESVVVSTADGWHIAGFLYFEGKSTLVLANHIVTGSDTGPLQPVKVRGIATEADFVIIPRNAVVSMEVSSL